MHTLAHTGLLALALAAAMPAAADHRKTLGGIEINIGVVPAAALLRVDAQERSIHAAAPTTATHHVVVGVSDARTGERIAGARVTLDVEDPRGGLQSAQLDAAALRGYPDYSGLFRFGWSGPYRLHVRVVRPDAAPVSATFNWIQEY